MKEEIFNGIKYQLDEEILTADVIENVGRERKVDIPEIVVFNEVSYRVTRIKVEGFSGNPSLASITIPDSVTEIGARAFANCHKLTDITIPDSVTSIGERAFLWCFSLSTVTIPNSVTTVGKRAFSGCGLASITIPDSITSIGEEAFLDCESLEEIVIGNSVKSIGAEAFCRCEMLTDIRFQGTIAQWERIELGDDWNDEVPARVVRCTDGDVEIQKIVYY